MKFDIRDDHPTNSGGRKEKWKDLFNELPRLSNGQSIHIALEDSSSPTTKKLSMTLAHAAQMRKIRCHVVQVDGGVRIWENRSKT